MSSSNDDNALRQWMYARTNPINNQVSDAYIQGLKEFMIVAKSHAYYIQKKKMFCRGYNFHTFEHGKDRKTFNYGVCVNGESGCDSSEESEFYGILTHILELYYPGIVGLRVVLFKCNWYDSRMGKGIRINKSGIIDVNRASRYGKYDPFILASQADQVCFVSYPRLNQKKGDWYAAIKIQPRGKIISSEEVDPSPLQYENDYTLIEADPSIPVDSLADQQGQFVNLEDVVDQELDSDADDVSHYSDTTEDESN